MAMRLRAARQCGMEMLGWRENVLPWRWWVSAPRGANWGGRCLSSLSYGGCTLGKVSVPTVRSVLHFEVPWLSCQLKMCVRQWRV